MKAISNQTKKIMDVKVPVQTVIGRTELTLQQVAELGTGSIIELDSLAGEPVEFLTGDQLIAKGEIVVIDESFGIRLTEMCPGTASPTER